MTTTRLVLLVTFLNLQAVRGSDTPIVNTKLGSVMGSVMQSRLGESFYAFRGIPYGKAPSDDLKFQAPVPVGRWHEVLDATQEGSMCLQPGYDQNEMSEDCLRLNVYTKDLYAMITTAPKRPVIVYIPGGAFIIGSGSFRYHAGPENLMDLDVVLVTINYRLSSLGFLATGTADAPGNAAMKDQVLALKWVRDHISSFGGDPHSVTIMGQSAGAMSVSLHLISPMSKGLFHRAILMSGAATAQWEIPSHQLDVAEQQADLVNCPKTPVKALIDCLKATDSYKIAESSARFPKFGVNPLLLWKPVVEPDFGQERFLTDDPIKLFQEGRFVKVPVLAGITQNEFTSPAIGLIQNNTLLQQFNENFYDLAPKCFLYEQNSSRSMEISDTLRKAYLNDKPVSSSSLEPLHHLFADGIIGFGVYRFINLVSTKMPVYYYKSSYVGRYSFLYYPDDKPYGVEHTDDLFYVLVLRDVAPIFNETDPESVTVKRMTRFWVHFAYTGNPNDASDDVIGSTTWPKYEPKTRKYLDIGANLTIQQGLYDERFRVWENLFLLNGARSGKSSSMSWYLFIFHLVIWVLVQN